MRETVVDLQTKDGLMNTFVFHPDGPGPFPVVIFYMDSVGVREELCDMCRRIATVGYYVIMPNLYYRLARSVDLDADRLHDPAYAESLAWMWKLNRSLSNTMVEQDTQAVFGYLDTDKAARKGKLGVVGYCMSGRFVFRVAGAFPDRVASSASVYGARLITDAPDSAHLLADKIKGEMYFACAEHDSYAPPETLRELQGVLDKAKINSRIEIYPEAEHGFAFPKRRLFHKTSTERHWERLFDMFRRTLAA
ncbi:carboxymethylenebutenolidase [Bradyrhizobium lablabi]|jgi:carboxymethylenebutenolidase|uniref:Carboxymethylenebutenolidase n=3 Tax=Nitrobacteraceae TaxID=41294 RepID=A0ABY0PTH3_9BRAD|nr:carboxymethylenebutenolidase [Bradyrhizobium ottawaense]SED08282.1 carboxymethylenebutenolidase [Bradyrhizobium lablabi]SHL14564.1 carboxymethylenebutenolidase [Bradyrhizobium lablabi]